MQDDWRVTPTLTLNLGMRWEYQQMPKVFLGNPAVPLTQKMPNDKTDFGPRLGFAWDIHGKGKDSLRGGYGIYYGLMGTSTIYNALVNTGVTGGQFSFSLSQAAGPVFPNTLATQPSSGSVAIQFFEDGFKLPRIHQADQIGQHRLGILLRHLVGFCEIGREMLHGNGRLRARLLGCHGHG